MVKHVFVVNRLNKKILLKSIGDAYVVVSGFPFQKLDETDEKVPDVPSVANATRCIQFGRSMIEQVFIFEKKMIFFFFFNQRTKKKNVL